MKTELLIAAFEAYLAATKAAPTTAPITPARMARLVEAQRAYLPHGAQRELYSPVNRSKSRSELLRRVGQNPQDQSAIAALTALNDGETAEQLYREAVLLANRAGADAHAVLAEIADEWAGQLSVWMEQAEAATEALREFGLRPIRSAREHGSIAEAAITRIREILTSEDQKSPRSMRRSPRGLVEFLFSPDQMRAFDAAVAAPTTNEPAAA